MTTIGSQYRGSQKFLLVQSSLIHAARERKLVYYKEVAELIGVPPAGHHMARQVGQVLGEISEDEHAANRPMLSAIAVAESGLAGEGFFVLARKLGKLSETGWTAEKEFMKDEQQRVYTAWDLTTVNPSVAASV